MRHDNKEVNFTNNNQKTSRKHNSLSKTTQPPNFTTRKNQHIQHQRRRENAPPKRGKLSRNPPRRPADSRPTTPTVNRLDVGFFDQEVKSGSRTAPMPPVPAAREQQQQHAGRGPFDT